MPRPAAPSPARVRGTDVIVLHSCWERSGDRARGRRDLLAERVARAARHHPGVPGRVVVTGGLVERALEREEPPQLVVLAHRPRSAGGSDARLLLAAVARQTGGDLLVVPCPTA